MDKNSKFRLDINALRAFAVVSVMLYHFNVRIFSVGFIGVDIFFVISGYLMTQIILGMLESNRFDYFKFILARVKRIWPALIALVAILSALGFFLLPMVDFLPLANQAKEALFFTSNLEFAKGVGYFTSNLEERWLLHTWSLSVEWQFYCLYPLFLFSIWRLFKALGKLENIRLCFIVILLVASLISYGYSVYLTDHNQVQAFFSLATRAWEMNVGGLVFLLAKTQLGVWFRRHSTLLKSFATLLILLCFYLGRQGAWSKGWPGAYALLPVIATGIYILAAESNKYWQWIENNKITQSLGAWSYSIYLWHWPVVIAINFLGFGVASFKLKLIGISLSLLLGYLSFVWLESLFKGKLQKSLLSYLAIITQYVLTFSMVLFLTSCAKNDLVTEMQEHDFYTLPDVYGNSKLKPEATLQTITLNAGAKKRVLVVGDSHAGHLYPWFKAHQSDNYSTTFAVTNGCSPIPEMNRFDIPEFYCHKSFEQVRELIAAEKFDVVVISGNWYSIYDDRFCPSAIGCTQSKNDQLKKMSEVFGVFLNELASQKVKVVIARPTPFADYEMGKVSSRYKKWGLNIPSSFPQTFIDNNAAPRKGDAFLDETLLAVIDQSFIYQIDFRPDFCRNETCRYFDENSVPVFWDGNHFSIKYIISHGQQLALLDDIVRAN